MKGYRKVVVNGKNFFWRFGGTIVAFNEDKTIKLVDPLEKVLHPCYIDEYYRGKFHVPLKPNHVRYWIKKRLECANKTQQPQ